MSVAVLSIVKILTISGLECCRVFTPLFIYQIALLRLPSFGVNTDNLANLTPPWLLNEFTVISCCVLSLVEIVAIYNCDIKEIYTSFISKYLKPIIATVIAFGFLSTKDTAIISSLVDNQFNFETTTTIVGSLACGTMTYTLDSTKSKVDDFVTTIAPQNEFNLQSIYNLLEDTWVLAILIFIILVPIFALILLLVMMLFTFLLKYYIKKQELKNSHPCPNCSKNNLTTLVRNSAVICQLCKHPQEDIRKVNFIGIPTKKLVSQNQITQHQVNLLSKQRCPYCSSILSNKNKCACCESEIWSKETFNNYTTMVDLQAKKYWTIVLLVTWIPIVGVMLEMFIVRLFILRPYMIYNTAFQKIKEKFFFRYIKLVLVLILGLGIITPYILVFFHYRQAKKYRKNFVENVQN